MSTAKRADDARDPSGHVAPSPATGPFRGSTGPGAPVRRRLSGAVGPFCTETLAYGAARRRTVPCAWRRCGAVKSRRAAPPGRDAQPFRPFWPMFAAQVPSITLNSPNLGEFPRVFLDDYRTYSDYMKLDKLGNMVNFTRTFADFSDAKISESSRKLRRLPPDCGLHRLP